MALKLMLPPAAYEGLMAKMQELVEEMNTAEAGGIVLESSYLSIVARK